MIIGSAKGGVTLPNENNSSVAFAGLVAPTIQQCTGYDDSDGAYGTGALRSCKIQASSSFTVTGLSCNCLYALGEVTLGLYSDNSGEPNVLLGYTSTADAVVGLHSYSMVSSVAISSGTDYWVAVYLSATAGLRREKSLPAETLKAVSLFTDTLPNPFGTVTLNDTDGLQLCFSGS